LLSASFRLALRLALSAADFENPRDRSLILVDLPLGCAAFLERRLFPGIAPNLGKPIQQPATPELAKGCWKRAVELTGFDVLLETPSATPLILHECRGNEVEHRGKRNHLLAIALALPFPKRVEACFGEGVPQNRPAGVRQGHSEPRIDELTNHRAFDIHAATSSSLA
jgi:hypothetical protein